MNICSILTVVISTVHQCLIAKTCEFGKHFPLETNSFTNNFLSENKSEVRQRLKSLALTVAISGGICQGQSLESRPRAFRAGCWERQISEKDLQWLHRDWFILLIVSVHEQ